MRVWLFQTVFLWVQFCVALPSADVLLEKAEAIRNPQIDYKVFVTLVDTKKGRKENRTYLTSIKGRSKALVDFLTPEVERGTKVLMIDDQMWVQMPATEKPLRISAKQRLLGNAAYGDITRLNFTGNYHAKIKGREQYKERKVIVLELAAISGKPVTYDRVDYWIDEVTFEPVKALYMTEAGKVLREGYFEDFSLSFGLKRPNKLVLVDYLEPQHITELIFSKFKKANLPELLFEKQNFGRN